MSRAMSLVLISPRGPVEDPSLVTELEMRRSTFSRSCYVHVSSNPLSAEQDLP